MTELVCTAARGTTQALAHELKALGATDIVEDTAAVSCRGELAIIPRANVFLRTASRVLLVLERFEGVAGADDLLERLQHVPFEERIDGKGTFCVDAHLQDVEWTHSLYAAQRVKDVVVDRLRDLGRGRPDVDTRFPHVRFVLAWRNKQATLSVDTSGEPLHARGYRRGVTGRAPLRETLAAAILAMAHAPADRPFLDPCCGTGTLAIEQAWRALKRAPGASRRFGFERWSKRPPELDRALALARTEAKEEEKQSLPAPIQLSDWHPEAVEAATRCVEQAGLARHVQVERCDARAAPMPGEHPVVCSNLPFGERLSDNRLQLEGFYRTIGEHLGGIAGARVILFSAHPHAQRLLGLDEKAATKPRRWQLSAGDLPATLFRFDLPR